MPNLVTGFNKALLTLAMKMSLAAYFNTMPLVGNVEVITKNASNSKYNPLYYVVKENKNLWIVTRGSFSVADWQTDFDFEQVKVKLGKDTISFHKGFYKAARNLYNNVKPYLEAHDGPIYFTGHSYGGCTTTAVLAIAMRKMPGKDFNGVAFAAAPTMGYVPKDIYNKLVSVVNNDDIVPTCSVGNAYRRYKSIIDAGDNAQKYILEKIRAFANLIRSSKISFAIGFADELERNAVLIVDTILSYVPKIGDVEFVNGNVYHVHFSEPKALSECVEKPQQTINELSVSIDSVIHHEGTLYLFAITVQKDE